jgi:hypothetical protein
VRRSVQIQAKRTAANVTGGFTSAGNIGCLILLRWVSQPCILGDITSKNESPAMVKDDLAV